MLFIDSRAHVSFPVADSSVGHASYNRIPYNTHTVVGNQWSFTEDSFASLYFAGLEFYEDDFFLASAHNFFLVGCELDGVYDRLGTISEGNERILREIVYCDFVSITH